MVVFWSVALLVAELGKMFAPGKCFIISNNQQCSWTAQRSSGSFGGALVSDVSRLGVPYSVDSAGVLQLCPNV